MSGSDQNKNENGADKTTQRVDELESRLAFQEDLIENLNLVVTRQDRELLVLKQQVAHLMDRVKDMGDAESMPGPASDFEVPPHY